MQVGIPILAVIGHKASGKTTIVEHILRELTKRRYQVATAKHISQRGFSMDAEGKDTWRHSAAGANPVISISDVEMCILIKNGIERLSLDKLLKFTWGADILLLEGFSSLALNDKRVGKIICIRDKEEYGEYKERAKGDIPAFCSFQPLGEPILKIKEDYSILIERTLKFVEKRRKILEILSKLPGLDCRKCGRSSCEEMAEDIYEGKAELKECIPLEFKNKMKTEIVIGDSEVPIQPFVSEIIRNAVLGMVSTLKGVSIEGDEKIHIKISK